jgi:L-iditol 2-dehydrogenase
MKRVKSAVLEKNKQIIAQVTDCFDLMPDECEVKIIDAGLCSSDIARSSDNGAYFYPLIMGHELAGEIINLGSDIDGEFSVGDKVCIFPLLPCFNCLACKQKLFVLCDDYDYYGSRRNGGFSESLNVKKWNLLKLPDGVNTEDGALIEPTAVALHAVKKLNINAQEQSSLCIFGAGFLGLIATQIVAKIYPNCKITLVDRNQFKLDIGCKYNAKSRWVGDEESWDLFLLDKEKSFDRVIEFVGNSDTFSAAIQVASAKSRVVWAGNISSDLTFSKQQVGSILRKELTILGTWNSIYKGEETCDWKESLNMIQKGLRPSELISLKIGLDDLGPTLNRLHKHKNRKSSFDVIKVMVKPNKIV